jgi:hypothetical protein
MSKSTTWPAAARSHASKTEWLSHSTDSPTLVLFSPLAVPLVAGPAWVELLAPCAPPKASMGTDPGSLMVVTAWTTSQPRSTSCLNNTMTKMMTLDSHNAKVLIQAPPPAPCSQSSYSHPAALLSKRGTGHRYAQGVCIGIALGFIDITHTF